MPVTTRKEVGTGGTEKEIGRRTQVYSYKNYSIYIISYLLFYSTNLSWQQTSVWLSVGLLILCYSAMLNVEKRTTMIIITTLICYGTWKLVWICSKRGTIANLNSYCTGKNKYLIFCS